MVKRCVTGGKPWSFTASRTRHISVVATFGLPPTSPSLSVPINSASPAISVHGLKKSYGEVQAVKGIDFENHREMSSGCLAPNGAGKTTTAEIPEGLRPRTEGQVAVFGFDPDNQRQRLKDRIGVCLQAPNLPEKIRVHEAMDVFASTGTNCVPSTTFIAMSNCHVRGPRGSLTRASARQSPSLFPPPSARHPRLR